MYVAHFMNAFAILSWEGIAAAPTTLRLSCSRALRQLATRTNAPWPHRIVCAGKHLIGLSGPFDLHDTEHATCNVRRATHNLLLLSTPHQSVYGDQTAVLLTAKPDSHCPWLKHEWARPAPHQRRDPKYRTASAPTQPDVMMPRNVGSGTQGKPTAHLQPDDVFLDTGGRRAHKRARDEQRRDVQRRDRNTEEPASTL